MSHYCDDVTLCRVDFFKPSGKWYCTEAIPITDYDGYLPDIMRKALRDHLGNRLQDMVAVCLDPYHKHTHPQMIKDW